jgi:hypothetical protein
LIERELPEKNLAKRFILVYFSLFRSAGYLVVALTGIALFAFLLTFPLWFAATNFPRIYTTAVLAGAALFLLYLLIQGLRTASREMIAAAAIRSIKALFLFFLLYLSAGFMASGRTGAALLFVLLLIGAAGFFRRGKG